MSTLLLPLLYILCYDYSLDDITQSLWGVLLPITLTHLLNGQLFLSDNNDLSLLSQLALLGSQLLLYTDYLGLLFCDQLHNGGLLGS